MKAGELQRTMSLLWFSLGHVIMTLHTSSVQGHDHVCVSKQDGDS